MVLKVASRPNHSDPEFDLFFNRSKHIAAATTPITGALLYKCLRAIQGLDNANRVIYCPVLLTRHAEAHLHNTELALDHPEQVLDRCFTYVLAFHVYLTLYRTLRLPSFEYVLQRTAICHMTWRSKCLEAFSTPAWAFISKLH